MKDRYAVTSFDSTGCSSSYAYQKKYTDYIEKNWKASEFHIIAHGFPNGDTWGIITVIAMKK